MTNVRKVSKRIRFSWSSFLLEVISIFLGITVAFWLNNWNEKRKQKAEEIKVLFEIKNGLEQDLIDMNGNLRGHRESAKAGQKMVSYIEGTSTQYDSIMFHWRLAVQDYTFIMHTAAYETLKSKGVNLISNDSLRLDIINVYDFHMASIVRMEQEEEAFAFYQNYSPAILNRLKHMKPHYYNNGFIKNLTPDKKPYEDMEFVLLTNQVIMSRSVLMNFYRRQIGQIESLVIRIDKELKELQN